MSVRLVQRRLAEAELRFLRRRKKRLVTDTHANERLLWARWVKRQTDSVLWRVVYTDGVTFYLDKTEEAATNSRRAALGLFVWREATNKDAMHKDCVGPSR